jgi:16S rRNA (uracil1498-N3)-methyltransferase
MHLFYQPELAVSAVAGFLTEDDSRHAVKTLRLGIGESIAVTDGHGNRYSAVISQADVRKCGFRIVDVQTSSLRPFSIRICVAPTKNIDRIEWFIEKAVEIGVDRISFFFGQHSERRVLKMERLEKIAVAAMKQSLQSYLPQLDEAVPFPKLLAAVTESQRFIAHLPDNEQPGHLGKQASMGCEYAVLIGPEGDFSESEIKQAVEAGFQVATLGPNRLRTETAALTACQVLNFINV